MGIRKTKLLGVAAVAVFALGAGGCSIVPDMPTVPDWVDPTTWFSDDSDNSADNAQTPDLAALPDKPAAAAPDDQQKVAESLASDRSNAKYSADALRAGTEASAAPPQDIAIAPVAESEEAQPQEGKATAPKAAAPKVAVLDRSIAKEPTGRSMPGTLPEPAPASQVAMAPQPEIQTATLPEPEPAPAPKKNKVSRPAVVAAAAEPAIPAQPYAPPPGAQPAVPPSPAVPVQVAQIAPSDAALGFQPSKAPPLDPTVAQFVPGAIIDNYRRTAANAGIGMGRATMMASGVPVTKLRQPPRAAVGGPESMTGSVVANLDALTPVTAPVSVPSVYANTQGLPATAVVFFPGDIVALNADAKAQVRAVVEQYRASGSQGYIRVVGHSSSRTPNMSVAQHMRIVFGKSQQRADAVAQAFIREGIPAAKVLVEAVGDSQPVYYESMPKGEDGNRRAEIFLQS
jgi:outer membrane protein OmpA-like peptidoglycan-associated protein